MSSGNYLSFTAKERTGILSLVFVLIVAIAVRNNAGSPGQVSENISREQLDSLHGKKGHYSQKKYDNQRDTRSRRDYGKYKNDNKKNTGVSSSASYKRDERAYYRKYSTSSSAYSHYKDRPEYTYRRKSYIPAVVNINTADTSAFIALPGIGHTLATRIVLFREKLGGFHSVAQIGEVYGLRDSVFQRIKPLLKCDSSFIKKLNINMVEKEELKEHPYIRWNIANAVVAYRQQHGNFSSLKDLDRIITIDSGTLRKVLPYLSLN